jgi:aminoglycoside phosphotransferase (APT) family kinase protein
LGHIAGPSGHVAEWLGSTFGPWELVADVSWPRPNSHVWRVQLADGPAFVKISPSHLAFARETDALVEVLPHAMRASVPRLLGANATHLVVVTSLVEGDVVRTLDPSPPAAVERRIHELAGSAIAGVHNDTHDAVGPRLRDTPRTRAADLLRPTEQRFALAKEALGAHDRGTVELAREALVAAAPRCPVAFVHGDFQPRNWLWSARTEQTSLIDFEAADTGFRIEDLAWLYATTWSRRSDLREAFLTGYGGEVLDVEWLLLAAVTTLAGLEHVADGVSLGIPVKVTNGLAAIRRAGDHLRMDAEQRRFFPSAGLS